MIDTESIYNTYCNAIMLRRCLLSDYMKAKITTKQLIEGITTCDILIVANYNTLMKNGMDKSRSQEVY